MRIVFWDKKTRQPADASYRLVDFIFLTEALHLFLLLRELPIIIPTLTTKDQEDCHLELLIPGHCLLKELFQTKMNKLLRKRVLQKKSFS